MAFSCSLIAWSVASGPTISRAGLPGSTRMNKKASRDAPKTASAAPPAFPRMLLNIGVPAARVEVVAGAVGDHARGRDGKQHADAREDADPPLPGEEVLEAAGDHD